MYRAWVAKNYNSLQILTICYKENDEITIKL